MKKIVLSIMLFLFTSNIFGQAPAFSKDYYLQKSKNQQKTGRVLLIGGTIMAVVGGISFNNNYNSSGNYGATDASGFLFLGGIVADLASIPFFISSSNNATKAATISLNNHGMPLISHETHYLSFQPKITLTIHLR